MQPPSVFHAPLEGVPIHGLAPYAEAVVEAGVLTVDVWLPGLASADVCVELSERAIRVASRSTPDAFLVGIVLPVPVRASTFVARVRNGVLEVRAPCI